MAERLFVYGTLRRDADGPTRPRRALREGARRLGEGAMEGRLYEAGGFPGAVREGGGRILGEVYALEDPGSVLEILDRYEGCRPDGSGLFRRERVPVRMAGGREVEAWVYLYNRPVGGLPEIESGDHLAGE